MQHCVSEPHLNLTTEDTETTENDGDQNTNRSRAKAEKAAAFPQIFSVTSAFFALNTASYARGITSAERCEDFLSRAGRLCLRVNFETRRACEVTWEDQRVGLNLEISGPT